MTDVTFDRLNLRVVFETSITAMVVVDERGTVVLVNAELERLLGYKREQLIGEPIERLVPAALRTAHISLRGSYRRSPKVARMRPEVAAAAPDLRTNEIVGLHANGTEIPLEVGLTPIATDDAMFVLASITPCKDDPKVRFRALVESSPNGIAVVDRDGRIEATNRELERMFGYDHGELHGARIETLIPQRLRGRHIVDRAGYRAASTTRAMAAGRDVVGLHKDGTEIPVEIGLRPIDSDRGTHVVASVVDVTARQRADAARRAFEHQARLSQRMESLGHLTAGLVHEFNNQLAGILSYTELIQRELPPEAPVQADLEAMLKVIHHTRQLVRRVLGVARRDEPVRRAVSLGRKLGEAMPVLRATMPANIELRLEANPETPTVFADPNAIYEAIINLVISAAHAMHGGGRIVLAVEPLGADPHVPPEREYAAITVHGAGGEPSALGLAAVDAIIRDHDGLRWVERRPGSGTAIRCVFPAFDARKETAGLDDELLPLGESERILYVDVDQQQAHVARWRLHQLKYVPVIAVSAREAIDAFGASPDAFDLMIADSAMPDMSGLGLARTLRAIRPNLPVVLMVDAGVPEIDDEVLRRHDIAAVLPRSVLLTRFATVIREVLLRDR